jgi:ABC-2 type transport system ATP-binding protein
MTSNISNVSIRLKNIDFYYKNVHALQNVSFAIHNPGIYSFVGSNGSGKSTLLRLIYGLHNPSNGSVELKNRFNKNLTTNDIAFIPDEDNLIQDLTTEEYLWFVSDCYGLPKYISKTRIEELIKMFGLENVKHRLIRGFSHGMRKRVQLAAGILPKTSILIIDEPTNGLDPIGTVLTEKVLNEIGKSQIVILATHNLQLAENVSCKVFILKKKIIIQGSPTEIANRTHTDNLFNAYVKLSQNQFEYKQHFNSFFTGSSL